ncbi:MAG: hypothetical protein AAF497_21280 [Planctomycetota bacterium]
MLNSATPPTLLVVLTEDNDPNPVAVPLNKFLQFSEEITFGLEDLVERWQHMAAPVASLAALRRGAMPT